MIVSSHREKSQKQNSLHNFSLSCFLKKKCLLKSQLAAANLKKYLPVLNASREVVIDRLIKHIATAKSGNIGECNFPFGHSD